MMKTLMIGLSTMSQQKRAMALRRIVEMVVIVMIVPSLKERMRCITFCEGIMLT